ncbi:MAG: SpoIIE family protein phosphatase, partial [Bacteroidetes bacterium]|nr:SpoIIE family protein phosphatase [Bacteroidota bacterium]
VVVLMSDGFTELVDEHGMMLEPERIAQEIETVADEGPRRIITHLAQRAAVWRGNAPLRDDLTVVVLKVKA